MCVLDLEISTKKHDSAAMNPASQYGSLIYWSSTMGLSSGMIFGKDSIKIGVKPKLRLARILTILLIPSAERCFFWDINWIADLNSKKSACFWVIKGYLIKWGIITSAKSLTEVT